jgi:ribosomal protein S18 acetylase RimI-like enzyme
MVDESPDFSNLPIPEEVRKAVDEILKGNEARDELVRIGVLEAMKRKGGEIRLVKKSGESIDLQIRNLEEDDLAALVKIINENYMDYPSFFYEFIPYRKETLHPAVKARSLVFVAKNQTIEGFIACNMDWDARIDMLCVKPGSNRAKTEDMLISKVEEEAKGKKVTAWLSSDNRIINFEKRGYEIYGGLYHLVRSLYNVPPVPQIEGVSLRSMAKGEEEAITKVFYDPSHVGTNIFAPGFTKKWKEDWNYIAELDGEIIAIICTRPDKKYNTRFNGKRVEIWGPISAPRIRTSKKWTQYRKALLCHALHALPEKLMELATNWDTEWPPEPANFRIGLGFRAKNHWKFLRKDLS